MENTAARIQRNTQCFFYLFLFDMKADGVLSKEDAPLSVQLLGARHVHFIKIKWPNMLRAYSRKANWLYALYRNTQLKQSGCTLSRHILPELNSCTRPRNLAACACSHFSISKPYSRDAEDTFLARTTLA